VLSCLVSCARCTVKRTCTGDNTALSWLSYGKAQCTKIVSVIPHQVQVQKDHAKMVSDVNTVLDKSMAHH